MAEVVPLVAVESNSALYSPRDQDPGRFDLNVFCNYAQKKVIDKSRPSLMMVSSGRVTERRLVLLICN